MYKIYFLKVIFYLYERESFNWINEIKLYQKVKVVLKIPRILNILRAFITQKIQRITMQVENPSFILVIESHFEANTEI